jgi:glutathione synthase/RimK-type ligase-like ATP-grasp enzyme
LRLLAVMGPGDMTANTPLDFVVDQLPVRLDLLFVTPDRDWPPEVPDHDVLMVALGESSRNAPLVAQLQRQLVNWPRPVVNRPDRIGRCARDAVCAILSGVPGLRIPATRSLPRAQPDWRHFPATIRPMDTHSGKGLARLDTPADLRAYLDEHEDDRFQWAEYIDYRSDDGLYRKYRIALIDGQPYVCHLAIAEHWIVHYQSAGMQHSADKRLEEDRQMRTFRQGFALRHADALRAIAHRLGLEYLVIDCAETREGSLLLFEADSRGWIHATDPVDLFPYKPPIMQIAFDAFEAMLRRQGRPAALPG